MSRGAGPSDGRHGFMKRREDAWRPLSLCHAGGHWMVVSAGRLLLYLEHPSIHNCEEEVGID